VNAEDRAEHGHRAQRERRAKARALVVGMGGLGCPAALALSRAGVGTIGLCDDDEVELSNLHRQILYAEADAGASKLSVAARTLRKGAPGVTLHLHDRRLLPAGAVDLVRAYDVVLEGSDNFATKFLAADACALAGVPIVQASAVRWVGTALAVEPTGRPCYRCLFEDLPGDAPNCAEAGVIGPVVGVVAAAQADLALAILDGERRVGGELVTFDGRTEELRRRTVAARKDCPLCGDSAKIRRIEAHAYAAPACAG
jgi:molybdopterin/thiamine biosynthesis adenylyltransferase